MTTRAWEAYGHALVRTHTGCPAECPPGALLDAALSDGSRFAAVCLHAELDVAEAQALAVLLAVEVSPELQREVAQLQGDPARTRLSLGALAVLLPPEGALVAAESGRLRRAALVEITADGPWSGWEVSPAGRLAWHLAGDGGLDPSLPPSAVALLGAGRPARSEVLTLVAGADRESRRQRASAELGGRGLLATPAPRTREEWDAVVREATLSGLAVLVEVDEEPPADLDAAVRRADHLAWGVSSPAELPLATVPDVPRRDVLLRDGTAGDPDWLAATGAPAPAGIRLERRQLQLVALSQDPPEQAVRRLAGGHLDRLATRVRPRRGWQDLVLAPALEQQVRGLIARYRQRSLVYDAWGFPGLPSRGTVALLAGPSGTGKTLTAEVVAGELGLDLFVLDLSSVMSKYIGETEKNLGALFDAAETGEAVLFFDEADALFGKRSPVSDAKDRYANVEVAYLLQRLERHDGLVLLATNLPANIDDAFVRRLHATLEYAAPDAGARRRLWARAFPPGCPTEELDLDLLAREVDLSGGPIAAAALAAAFAAAASGTAVTMAGVAAAVGAEYRKQGRLAVPDLQPA